MNALNVLLSDFKSVAGKQKCRNGKNLEKQIIESFDSILLSAVSKLSVSKKFQILEVNCTKTFLYFNRVREKEPVKSLKSFRDFLSNFEVFSRWQSKSFTVGRYVPVKTEVKDRVLPASTLFLKIADRFTLKVEIKGEKSGSAGVDLCVGFSREGCRGGHGLKFINRVDERKFRKDEGQGVHGGAPMRSDNFFAEAPAQMMNQYLHMSGRNFERSAGTGKGVFPGENLFSGEISLYKDLKRIKAKGLRFLVSGTGNRKFNRVNTYKRIGVSSKEEPISSFTDEKLRDLRENSAEKGLEEILSDLDVGFGKKHRQVSEEFTKISKREQVALPVDARNKIKIPVHRPDSGVGLRAAIETSSRVSLLLREIKFKSSPSIRGKNRFSSFLFISNGKFRIIGSTKSSFPPGKFPAPGRAVVDRSLPSPVHPFSDSVPSPHLLLSDSSAPIQPPIKTGGGNDSSIQLYTFSPDPLFTYSFNPSSGSDQTLPEGREGAHHSQNFQESTGFHLSYIDRELKLLASLRGKVLNLNISGAFRVEPSTMRELSAVIENSGFVPGRIVLRPKKERYALFKGKVSEELELRV